MAKQVVMAIGMPFSGKSQLAKEYEAKGWRIIERDRVLEEIVHSKDFRRSVLERIIAHPKDEVTEEDFNEIRDAVATQALSEKVIDLILKNDGERIFYDGTNLQKKTRAPLIALRDRDIAVSGIFLDVPLDEIWQRAERSFDARQREGSYNEQAYLAIEEMYRKLEKPEVGEGFSELEIREWKPAVEQQEFKGLQ